MRRARVLSALVVAAASLPGCVDPEPQPPPIVFVHGLGGSAADVGAGTGSFGGLLGRLARRYPREDVCQDDAQPDRPWTGSPCVFRYVDDAAVGGDSLSGAEENAEKLAAEVEEVWANAGEQPVTLIGFSMGGLIIRTYLALHREDASRHVGAVVLIDPAAAGSWLLAPRGALGALSDVDAVEELVQRIVAARRRGAEELDRPAYDDLTPGSPLIRRVASLPVPTDAAYTTVWGDLDVTLDLPGGADPSLALGDILLLPGDPDPRAVPPLGGQRFRPTDDALEIRHGGEVTVTAADVARLTAACASGDPDTCLGALTDVLRHPSAHGELPSTLDDIRTTHAVLGSGTLEDLVVRAAARATA